MRVGSKAIGLSRVTQKYHKFPPRFHAEIQRHFGMETISSCSGTCLVTACCPHHPFSKVGVLPPNLAAQHSPDLFSVVCSGVPSCKCSFSIPVFRSLLSSATAHPQKHIDFLELLLSVFVMLCNIPAPPSALFLNIFHTSFVLLQSFGLPFLCLFLR